VQNFPPGLFADAEVVAQVGPIFNRNRGFASVVRNGVGDYSLTLSQPRIIAEHSVLVSCQSALSRLAVWDTVGSTIIRVRTFTDAGAAAEVNFTVRVQSINCG
jgi:hypothetical protein